MRTQTTKLFLNEIQAYHESFIEHLVFIYHLTLVITAHKCLMISNK